MTGKFPRTQRIKDMQWMYIKSCILIFNLIVCIVYLFDLFKVKSN